MNITDTSIKYKEINSLIDTNQISKSINSLKEFSSEFGYNEINTQLSLIEETYRYLIHYLLEGIQDNGREDILADIRERLYTVNDLLIRNIESKDSRDYYYETLRFNNYRNERVDDLLQLYGKMSSELSLAELGGNDTFDLRKSKEDVLKRLFNTLVTSFANENDYKDLKNYLLSGYADASVAAQAISAITLSLLKFYDRSKFNLLLEIYEGSDEGPLSAHAIVALCLTFIFHSNRIVNDPKFKYRLSLWNDEDASKTKKHLHFAFRSIIGTIDTQRVASKMKDEVLPELIKLRPDILKSIQEGNSTSELMTPDFNPEWEDILEKSGLNDKLRELSEMQGEGADLLMVTFSNLKNFPFFDSASNWFLPFDVNNTSLNLDEDTKRFIGMMTDLGTNVCDSDLYSLALASEMMPSSQRELFSQQISSQFDQMSSELKDQLASTSSKYSDEILKVVRDLYRFFKLYKKRYGFNDPFEKNLDFLSIPIIGKILEDEEILRPIAEFYFKRKFYKEALPLFRVLIQKETDNSTLWEKQGFCLQITGDFFNALEAYNKAALLKSPGPWLIKKLAFVNRKLSNYEDAVTYYRKALDMDPENLQLIINLGNTLIEAGENSAALQEFYHANYNSPDNPKILRSIAWLELLNGNLSKSQEYYSRIIKMDALWSDYLNSGHASMLLGNYREALNFYRLASKDDYSLFFKSFNADLGILEKLGLNKNTAQIIMDQVNNKF